MSFLTINAGRTPPRGISSAAASTATQSAAHPRCVALRSKPLVSLDGHADSSDLRSHFSGIFSGLGR